MKNLVMFLLSFSLMFSTSVLANTADKEGGDCCGRIELSSDITDMANYYLLSVNVADNNTDTSGRTVSRTVEPILPLYDLSLSSFAVVPDNNPEISNRRVKEVSALYDLGLSNFSVENSDNRNLFSRKVSELNPLYDLSLSHFAVKQAKAITPEVSKIK